ncbi:UDP-glucose 4-epimerase [Toxorhynchites rutilus septentrionalis]|uniref:UDP-glucose 4-epimerase n=1 Tax=Toxorhynchites rutilus septentrionalis TaxID=329112 RepID=UPI002479F62C|nr:UDP-glucose 4-epimerase [Toxorhynchites rutilus septentrionalis]
MVLNILVTGGAGFVGSHTVLELLNAGHRVICVDNLCNAYEAANSKLPESLKRVEKITGKTVDFYDVDIRDKDALNEIFKKNKVDVVAHFAALKAVGESCRIPLQYYQNNITGTSVLLEVMAEANVFNFVYSSSATVYGEPQKLPLDENHPTGSCTNPYGKSKYFTEEILKDLCSSDPRWKVISLRYFNPVGAHKSGLIGEDPNGEPNNLMPYIAQVAVGRRACLKVFGNDYDTPDGTGVRDYIHIVDLAEGHVSAIGKLMSGNLTGFVVYNLGTGHGYSVLKVVEAFSKASAKTIKYEIVERRPGDIATSYADVRLAAKELGWKAKRGLKEMCEDAWNWQNMNPNGFAGAS